MVETKRYKVQTESVKEALNLQLLKGVDKPFGEREEVRETALIKEPLLKADTITVKVKADEEKVIAVYEDKVLDEKYAEVFLRKNKSRLFIKDLSKAEKELQKWLLTFTDEVEEALKKAKELKAEIDEVIEDEVLEERPIAGALINLNRILPFATFNADGAIPANVNPERVEEINAQIEELRSREKLTPEEEEKLERLYRERRKAYQPVLSLAVGVSDSGSYLKPSSSFRLGENLNRATEGGNVILLLPIAGVAQGKLVFKRIGFVPRNKYDTDQMRRKLYLYRSALEASISGKKPPQVSDKSLQRRISQLAEYYRSASEEGKEGLKNHLEELRKAERILDGILFPKSLLSPYQFEVGELSPEEFKAFAAALREAERKIEEVIEEYTPELTRIAQALRKLEGKELTIIRETGSTKEVFYPENLRTRDTYTSVFLSKVAKHLGIDLEEIAQKVKEVKILDPSGNRYNIGGLAYAFINQKVGEIYNNLVYLEGKNELEENEELKQLKEYVEEFVKEGRKPLERKTKPALDFDVELPLEELISDVPVGGGKIETKPQKEEEDLESLLFGDEGNGEKKEEDLDDLDLL